VGHRHTHRRAQGIVTDARASTNLHVGQPTGAGERLANDLHFRIVLNCCRDVLPVATAATVGNVPTRGLHPRRDRRRDTHEPRPCEIAPYFDKLGLDVLARNDAANENDSAVDVARHAVTARDESFDVQSSSGTDAHN